MPFLWTEFFFLECTPGRFDLELLSNAPPVDCFAFATTLYYIFSYIRITEYLFILFVTGIMQAQDRKQPQPGNAPIVKIKKPQSFIMPNGLKVMVVENHKLPRVTFNLTLDNAPYAEANKKGVDDLSSELIGNGTKKNCVENTFGSRNL